MSYVTILSTTQYDEIKQDSSQHCKFTAQLDTTQQITSQPLFYIILLHNTKMLYLHI